VALARINLLLISSFVVFAKMLSHRNRHSMELM